MQIFSDDQSIPQDNQQIVSSLCSDSQMNEESLAGGSGAQLAHGASLRAEANADFKSLQGYWKRIIVKDMACKTDLNLPDLFIC